MDNNLPNLPQPGNDVPDTQTQNAPDVPETPLNPDPAIVLNTSGQEPSRSGSKKMIATIFGLAVVAILSGGVFMATKLTQQPQEATPSQAANASKLGRVEVNGRTATKWVKNKNGDVVKKVVKLKKSVHRGLKLKANGGKVEGTYYEGALDENGNHVTQDQNWNNAQTEAAYETLRVNFLSRLKKGDVPDGFMIRATTGCNPDSTEGHTGYSCKAYDELNERCINGDDSACQVRDSTFPPGTVQGIYLTAADLQDADKRQIAIQWLERVNFEGPGLEGGSWTGYFCEDNNTWAKGCNQTIELPAGYPDLGSYIGQLIDNLLYGDKKGGNCGVFQADTGNGFVSIALPCGSGIDDGNDEDDGGDQFYNCDSLSMDKKDIELNDTVTFSCEASFYNYSPLAYFRYSSDGGENFTNEGVAHDLSEENPASMDLKIDKYGSWVVQCRVCTDETNTDCTDWNSTAE